MTSDRSWIADRLDDRGLLSDTFMQGVERFLDFAFSQAGVDDKIRCPCIDCGNRQYLDRDTVECHLFRKGFVIGYNRWEAHGEAIDLGESSNTIEIAESTPQAMVMDAMGPELYNAFINDQQYEREGQQYEREEHAPNRQDESFYKLLEEADQPIWPGCSNHTKLSAMSQLLNCKLEFNMSASCYDRLMSIVKDMLPEGHHLEDTFYKTKKMLSGLDLGVKKIHACVNDCMLYYGENENLIECLTCHQSRYKTKVSPSGHKVPQKVLRYLPLIPRLQRLYMSRATTEHMIWHSKNGYTSDGEMSHPVHSEAWKHFDRTYPQFSLDPRSVRLGLCTDGFSPFNMSGAPYSCWPVIITVYNLPPLMCMKQDHMFLNMVIPGPTSPGRNIDVYLRPLIDELKLLWSEGVQTYDVHTRKNFNMRAALMWTISDFPGYGMLYGWSTHGLLSCPYCMSNTKSFLLKNGQKASFFYCHRQILPQGHPFRKQRDKFFKGRVEKDEIQSRPNGEQLRRIVENLANIPTGTFVKRPRTEGFGRSHNWGKKSIFWELPYWHTNLIRHNLNVMHIEKNFFDNVFNTVMDTKDKTKDNVKARKDLEIYCNRPELHIVEGVRGKLLKPKASYSLTKEQKREILKWIKTLRMPDSYASNIARCVKGDSEFYGMKSHDCHIFIQRLMPIAFKYVLPGPIWEALTEISHFFRDICSTTVKVNDMIRLEENIITTICKLEKIFPPAFFDSMEHLPIHLAYEARVGGPVQYRWMYPFERFLHHLKKKVTNRACVEASIVEAYLVEETSTFCSFYFDNNVEARINRVPRNNDGGCRDPSGRLSIFSLPGRHIGTQCSNCKYLTDEEYKAASTYVLLNCEEISPFVEEFDKQMKIEYPQITDEQLDRLRDERFTRWLKSYVDHGNNVDDCRIKDLAMGPSRRVRCYNGYYINGYRFHTFEYGLNKATINSGVCVLGSTYNDCDRDYYGMLKEIMELEYIGDENRVTLFKCDWFDNERGVQVHPRFNLVEVNHKRKLVSNDVFVLAQQAQQVYYTTLPSKARDKRDWSAVVKTKARHVTDIRGIIPENEGINLWLDLPFQEDPPEITLQHVRLTPELDNQSLVHEESAFEEVHVQEVGNNVNSQAVDVEEVAEDNEEIDTHVEEADKCFTTSESDDE